MKEKRNYCSICNNLTENPLCIYCASTTQDRSQICVIEENCNLINVEKSQNYKGLYHILHGSLSPSRGIGPNNLMLSNLFPRLMPNANEGIEVKEIIIAANLTTESEATASYIARLLKPLGIPINKIEVEMTDVIETETIQ